MTLKAQLSAPWDGLWLEEKWPEIFRMDDDDPWTVFVLDLEELVRVSYTSETVDVTFDGDGLVLCVFRDCLELVAS